jgi:hypothetical protein
MTKLKKFLSTIKPKKKLHIFYKHVHSATGRNRPHWFTHEKCFQNLLFSLESKKTPFTVHLTVLFDESLGSYEDDFVSQYSLNSNNYSFSYALEKYHGGSQRLAGLHLLNYIANTNVADHDLIYILENDYLHAFDWMQHLYELQSSDLVFDYVSLYDHSDKYLFQNGFHKNYANLQSQIFVAGQRHWRTVPSTCYTFITRGKTFREDFEILKSDLMDHQMFGELEKKGRTLISPIPSLATHCMSTYLSPCISWEKYLVDFPTIR